MSISVSAYAFFEGVGFRGGGGGEADANCLKPAVFLCLVARRPVLGLELKQHGSICVQVQHVRRASYTVKKG